MKQTNKIRRTLSAALLCASLFMTSCSKDAFNEETLSTKAGISGYPQGSLENPFPPQAYPDVNKYIGGNWHYFDMRLGVWSFNTEIPANQHGMIISISGAAVSRTIKYEMTKRGGVSVCGNSHTISTAEGSVILRIPAAACGPYPTAFLPAERVKVKITMPPSGKTGFKFTYFKDKTPTQPPYPPTGV